MSSFASHGSRGTTSRYSTSNYAKEPRPFSTQLPLRKAGLTSPGGGRASTSAGGYATARDTSSSGRRWVDVTTERPKLTPRRSLAPRAHGVADTLALKRSGPVKPWSNSSLSTGSYYQSYLKQKGLESNEDGSAHIVAPWDHGPPPHPRQRDPMPTARSEHPPVGAEPEKPSPHVARRSAARNYGESGVLDQRPADPPKQRSSRSHKVSNEFREALDEAEGAKQLEEQRRKLSEKDTQVAAPYRWRKTPEPFIIPEYKANAVERTLATTFELNDDPKQEQEKERVHPLATSRRQKLISGRVGVAPWSGERQEMELAVDDEYAGANRAPKNPGRKHVGEPRVIAEMAPTENGVVPPYLYEKSYKPGIRRSYKATTGPDSHHTIPLDDDIEAVHHAETVKSIADRGQRNQEPPPWTREEASHPRGPATGVTEHRSTAPYIWDGNDRADYELHSETRKKHVSPHVEDRTFGHILPDKGTSSFAQTDSWIPTARDVAAEQNMRQAAQSAKTQRIEARRARMAERAAVESQIREQRERAEMASLGRVQRHNDMYSDPLSFNQ